MVRAEGSEYVLNRLMQQSCDCFLLYLAVCTLRLADMLLFGKCRPLWLCLLAS